MRKAIIFALAFLLLLPLVKADTYLTSCAVLDTPGETYYLTQDIINSSTSTCMNITADNVTLDCQGHIIDGIDASLSFGIYTEAVSSITIKNCVVSDWGYGIYLYYSNSNTLSDIISNSNRYGVNIAYSNDYNLSNITANSNLFYGILIEMSDYITIKNSYFINNSYYDVNVEYLTDRESMYCHSYFENVTGTDDKPIVFFNSTIEIRDWNNNASEIILCGADGSIIDNIIMYHTDVRNNGLFLIATNSTNISNSLFNNLRDGVYLYYSGFNVISNITSSNNTNSGLLIMYSDFNTISNITANYNKYGIWLSSSNYNNLSNAIASSNSLYGVYVSYSNYNTIKDSIFQDNAQYGIRVWTESYGNLVYNNLFNNTNNFGYGGGVIYYNGWNTTKQVGERVYSPGNYIGGNYWTNSTGNGYSDTCTDVDKDGFCDDPYVLATDNVDYLALSDEYSPPTTTTTLPPVHGVPLLSSTLVGVVIGSGILIFMLRTLFDITMKGDPKKIIEYFIVLAVIVLTVLSLTVLFA